MIEVQRQGEHQLCLLCNLVANETERISIFTALRDLGDMLKERNLPMPKQLILQFDNCGENKVCLLLIYLQTAFHLLTE